MINFQSSGKRTLKNLAAGKLQDRRARLHARQRFRDAHHPGHQLDTHQARHERRVLRRARAEDHRRQDLQRRRHLLHHPEGGRRGRVRRLHERHVPGHRRREPSELPQAHARGGCGHRRARGEGQGRQGGRAVRGHRRCHRAAGAALRVQQGHARVRGRGERRRGAHRLLAPHRDGERVHHGRVRRDHRRVRGGPGAHCPRVHLARHPRGHLPQGRLGCLGQRHRHGHGGRGAPCHRGREPDDRRQRPQQPGTYDDGQRQALQAGRHRGQARRLHEERVLHLAHGEGLEEDRRVQESRERPARRTPSRSCPGSPTARPPTARRCSPS